MVAKLLEVESCSTCTAQQARADRRQALSDRPALVWQVQASSLT